MSDTADAVVVGGGTVGAWCAYFLRQAGLARVVLIEKGLLGQGASSRAAGVVRMQGGTPEAVRLGQWSRRFYLRQRDEIGTDSGFTEQGYLLPCFTEAEVAAAHARMAMQAALGVPVRWLDPAEVDAANPTLAPGQTLGGTFCDQDGFIAPPRNVAAYTVALIRGGVEVRERVAFRGLEASDGGSRRDQPGADRRGAGGAHRRAEARRGRPPGRDTHPGRRRQAPGRGHRAAPGPGSGPGADGVRPGRGALLAARRGRPAVRHEQPGRAAGREPRGRRGLPGQDAGPAGRAGAGHRRARAAPDLGGDHRLHPGSPAHHRPRARAGRRHGGQRGRGRHDVGARAWPGPRPTSRSPAPPRCSTRPRSASTVSTRPATAASRPTPSPCPSRRGSPHHDHRHPVPGHRGRRQARGLGAAG